MVAKAIPQKVILPYITNVEYDCAYRSFAHELCKRQSRMGSICRAQH